MIKKLLLLATITGCLTMISCKKENETTTPNTNTNTTKDSLSNTPQDTTKNNNTSTEIKVDAVVINGEEIKFTSVTYGSGQLRAQAATNNQDLDKLIIFFPNGNTGNGLNIPSKGDYTLIESVTGLVTVNNQACIRFTYKSDVYNFMHSKATSGKLTVGKEGDFHTFKMSNVSLHKYKHTFGNANSGPSGESITLNTQLQIKAETTSGAGGTITENSITYTASSVTKKVSTNGLYTEIEFKVSGTSTITLKLNVGTPTLSNGTYKVISWSGVEPKADEVQLYYSNISFVDGNLKSVLAYSNSDLGGSVTIEGNKVTFTNVKFKFNTEQVSVSGDFSF